jgi:hypothetical protein
LVIICFYADFCVGIPIGHTVIQALRAGKQLRCVVALCGRYPEQKGKRKTAGYPNDNLPLQKTKDCSHSVQSFVY